MPVPHNLSEEDKERLRWILEPASPTTKGPINEKVRLGHIQKFERMGLIKSQDGKVELTADGRHALSQVHG